MYVRQGDLAYRVRILEEIGNAYRDLFPERYREALALAKEARDQVTPLSKDGTMSMRVRIPTEIFLFIRRYIPDFGEKISDIGLLCSVWPDLKVND